MRWRTTATPSTYRRQRPGTNGSQRRRGARPCPPTSSPTGTAGCATRSRRGRRRSAAPPIVGQPGTGAGSRFSALMRREHATRRLGFVLDVGPGDREVDDQRDHGGREHGQRGPVAEADTATVLGLADVVGERRPQRSGHHVRGPEHEYRVEPEDPADQRWDHDDDGEEDPRREVAKVQRNGRVVAERRAERERREDGRPVERLAPSGRDAVDRERPLAAEPDDEHRSQGDRPQQARPRVRDVGRRGAGSRRHRCRRSRWRRRRTSRRPRGSGASRTAARTRRRRPAAPYRRRRRCRSARGSPSRLPRLRS